MGNEIGEIQEGLVDEMVKSSKDLANLHRTITSPNGDYFNSALLHELRKRLNEDQLEEFRKKANVFEYERHLHKFSKFNLIIEQVIDGKKVYERTALGEEALNAIREMESKIGLDKAREIYECGLGRNSIELFLKLYGKKRFFLSRFLNRSLEIKYGKSEILRQFSLPSGIEGISAIDKFVESGLFVYEKGYFYLDGVKARSFYQYLKKLYKILEGNE